MLLAVDVGNTQTVLGIFEGGNLTAHWRVATDKTATTDELHVKLRALLALEGFQPSDILEITLSSVVPELTELWRGVAVANSIPCLVIDATLKKNFEVKYSNPGEIGADRLADAAAAIERYGSPVTVVDLGTATNMEVIDRGGAFLGGIIAPGFITSADALFDAAARIPRFDLVAPRHVIGDSTKHAVQSGLLYGEVARIDGLVKMVFFELGYETKVIATGGLASYIAPLSSVIDAVDENLTLEGLRILHDLNVPIPAPDEGTPAGDPRPADAAHAGDPLPAGAAPSSDPHPGEDALSGQSHLGQ